MESKCSAFWRHTNVRSDNNIFPCCRYKEPIATFDGDVEKILHLQSYKELRQQSLNNEPIAGCSKCYEEERIGKKSLREKFNEEYTTDAVALEYLEIGFDNICNLTCDGCWSDFSSAWAKKQGLDKTIQIRTTDPITKIPNTINKLLFLGGEPLMTTRHIKLLDLVEYKSQVEVTYNTNGTFLFSDDAVSLLQQFKQVNVILSIDGYGDLNERVRSGSSWKDILAFIKQVRSLGYTLEIHTVIHINNWHGLKQLESFVNVITDNWSINFLTYPKHLDIVNEPRRDDVIKMLKSIELVDLSHIINRLCCSTQPNT